MLDFRAYERAQIEHEKAVWDDILRRERSLWQRAVGRVKSMLWVISNGRER